MAGTCGGRSPERAAQRAAVRRPVGIGASVAEVPRLSSEDARRVPGGVSVLVVNNAERVTRLVGGTKVVRSTATTMESESRGMK